LLSEMKAGLVFSQIQRIAFTLEEIAERMKKIALRCHERCQQFSPLSDSLSR
jgi:hypothetical protein